MVNPVVGWRLTLYTNLVGMIAWMDLACNFNWYGDYTMSVVMAAAEI